ncbi:MAG: hypothetical protein KQJ78_04485 [Deltaproteobacteria bacterium]|nr:hypothetical protein [Deltaproteobacteria bacterium]
MAAEPAAPGGGRFSRQTLIWALFFLLATGLFWGLRASYWAITTEVPFSDMSNYQTIATGILQHGDFSQSDFWRSYRTPTTPLLRALQMALTGPSLTAWQWFLATLTFLSLAWLAWEVGALTRSRYLALALVLTVALAKGSIFWSYKLSRESVAEPLVYLGLAAMLAALRRPRPWLFLLAGAVNLAAALNRPNAFVTVPLFAAGLAGAWLWARRGSAGPNPARGKALAWGLAAFLLGVVLVWSPWLVRNWRIYHRVVPFSSQGPFSFLWDLGRFRVELPDGRVLVTDAREVRAQVMREFPSDMAGADYAQELGRLWLAQNWRAYLRLLPGRAWAGWYGDQINLTRVSRRELFPAWWNAWLPDRAPGLLFLGLAGLVALGLAYGPRLWLLPVMGLTPWLATLPFLGLPRMLEPSVPLLLFGVAAWPAVGLALWRRWRSGPDLA